MKKGNLTNEESRRVFKKVMKARKRRKAYLLSKHLKQNKKKKGGRIIIDGKEFRTDKKGRQALDQYMASKKKPETKAIAAAVKRSWWRRLLDRIAMWYNKGR